MKDVHALPPARGSPALRRVGVVGLKKPLVVRRPDHLTTLTVEFEVSVDLPAERKGSDLSRNAQLLAETVDRTSVAPVSGLESACSSIAEELLARHPTAHESTARGRAVYFLPRGVDDARRSMEDYLLFAEAWGERSEGGAVRVRRSVGVEAVGMTACPCAMEACRERLSEEYPALKGPSYGDLPVVTHNQRNRTRLTIELPDDAEVEADEMIEVVEAAQSSPTFAILKRGDEATVVLNAHRRPMFVEDVVRDVLARVKQRFPQLPGSTVVHVETTSEESIHKYDVRASHSARLEEIRADAATG